MKILITVILLMATGCGDYQGLQEESEADSQELSEESNGDGQPGATETNVEVDVEVQVDVTVTTVDPDAPEYIYSPELVDYYEAEDNIPDGYHIPTRGELLLAIDEGDIQGSGRVWTSTDAERSGDDDVYTVSLTTGNVYGYMKINRFTVIYFKGSQEVEIGGNDE